MRKMLLAATAATLVFAGATQAGSEGFYVGLSAGHEFATVDGVGSNAAGLFPIAYDYDAQGGTIGVLAGFNFVADNMVFGVEGDINWSDLDEVAPLGAARYHGVDVNYEAAARARFGIIHGNNVVYVAGGYAVADMDVDIGFNGSAPFHSYSITKSGWTLGAGLDHAFDESVSGRIEYRYTDYGADTTIGGVNSRDDNNMTSNSIRVALLMKL